MAITKAQETRLQQALSKQYNFDGVIMPLGKYLEENKWVLVERIEPKYEYNRRKYNAMNHEQQAEYEKQLSIKVTRSYAKLSDGLLLPVPKLLATLAKDRLNERKSN